MQNTQIYRGFSEIIEMLGRIHLGVNGREATVAQALVYGYNTARTPQTVEQILIHDEEAAVIQFIHEVAKKWDGENFISGALRCAIKTAVLYRAQALGKAAYRRGELAAPAMDPEFMRLIAWLPIGDEALAITEAWSAGWVSESLKGDA